MFRGEAVANGDHGERSGVGEEEEVGVISVYRGKGEWEIALGLIG